MLHIPRRQFLQLFSAGLLSSAVPYRLSFAQAQTPKRLLFVILRGGMDGLHAVVPISDNRYQDMRGNMAMPIQNANLITLDRDFAMHNALEEFANLYQQKQLLFVHGVSAPYRGRSHFDAQMILERGAGTTVSAQGGWLNRAVAAMPDDKPGLSIGTSMPLVMQGAGRASSWSPSRLPGVKSDLLQRVARLYESDEILNTAFNEAKAMKEMGGGARGGMGFAQLMRQTAIFMRNEKGPRIATIDLDGWDTHENQNQTLDRLFRGLGNGLRTFKDTLGYTWQDTAVLIATEFGRTVSGNGTQGTDHGTGSVAFLAGGRISGGKMVGDYPGLSKLYENRDLLPANDIRSLFKATLMQHLSIDFDSVENTIFPQSKTILPYPGLFY